MRSPLPPKRKAAREALPAVYLVLRGGLPLWHTAAGSRDLCRTTFADLPGDRIQKYIPAPRAGKAKGGKRG